MDKKIIDSKWFRMPRLSESKELTPGLIWEGSLSDDDLILLNASLDTYDQLLRRNARQREARMSEQDWIDACRPWSWESLSDAEKNAFDADYAENTEAFKQRLREQTFAMGTTGIPAKSSLLWRLLSQKKPLRSAPPTSYSYPWYPLVEQPLTKNVSVSLGGVMSLSSLLKGVDGAPRAAHVAGVEALVINQSAYSLVGANEAGEALVKAASEIALGWSDDVEVRKAHPAWDRLKQAYAAQPELIVKHGDWPAWVLKAERCTPRQYSQRYLDRLEKEEPFFGVNNTGPLDLMCANLGLQIERGFIPPDQEEYAESEDEQRARRILDALEGRYPGAEISRSQGVFLNRAWLESGDGHVIPAPPKEPDAYVSTLQWNMHKSAEWANLNDSEIYANG